MTKLTTLSESLKIIAADEAIANFPTDHHFVGGGWATPCMCGHDSHGYSGHCEHMCCDTDDCECGGYEPQPGMALPVVRREGMHPFLRALHGGSKV